MDIESSRNAANTEEVNQLIGKTMSPQNQNNNFDELLERLTAFMEQSSTEASARMTRLEEEQLAASERLQRVESVVAANANSIRELNMAVNQIFQVVELNQKNFEVVQQNFEIIVGQIKGLQAENRNILDHLFGIEDREEG
jgi:septation ring formation regulator EzrA